MKQANLDLIKLIIEESVWAGIFEKLVQGTSEWVCNLNAVSKPQEGIFKFVKADKIINSQKGVKTRICLDLNKIVVEQPKVQLPRVGQLKESALDCHLLTLDLSQFFYALWLQQDSKIFTNFHLNGSIYCHAGCPMGLYYIIYF